MNSRERVLASLNFTEPDQIPKDLGAMPSTGISCFAYPRLVKALGLPPRNVRVHDTSQMLALADTDVLDALGCDVVTIQPDLTNAYPQPERWHPYDFNGRLDAAVFDPTAFEVLPDGSLYQRAIESQMLPSAYVFSAEHGGQPLVLNGPLPKPNLDTLNASLEAALPTLAEVNEFQDMVRHARRSTDRAIMFHGISAGIGIGNFTGIAMFPLLCLLEPEFVVELHELVVSHAIKRMERYLPEVADHIDIYMSGADDWGTQNNTIASPDTYRSLFQPYYRRMNDAIHAMKPDIKCFFHSCGAVYDLIDDFIDSGFDILNPVQWTAGGHSWKEWKDKARKRIALWGGGVDTQGLLSQGSEEAVADQVREITAYMGKDGGYVFGAIHNILAEIDAHKIITLYRAATP
ncbi:MAG: hypothetical protein GX117_09520 [Candidatus Hydrogenedentes bacterium]|jgi:uroporphyrinogen decarboxylase|nr:hypothetical protein [Candidatus Hydrogenedentota bacterium]